MIAFLLFKQGEEMKTFIQTILFMSLVFAAKHVNAEGIEDLMLDLNDYLGTRVIPAAAGIGVTFGSIMAGTGNPKGMEIIKYSVIGGIIGTAGSQTLSALFF